MAMQPLEDRPIRRSSSVLARYEAVLERAVDNLSASSPTARAAFYERTRMKLASEMRSAGRSTSMESELRVFDEAVERLEDRLKEQEPDPTPAALSEVIKFQPAKSNDWLDSLLDRASSDDVSKSNSPSSGSPNPASPNPPASSTSDKWLSDLLARASLDDEPQPVSKTPASQSLHASRPTEKSDSSKKRRGDLQLASAQTPSEIVSKRLALAEESSRRWNTAPSGGLRHSEEPDISRMLEDAMAKELEDLISESQQNALQVVEPQVAVATRVAMARPLTPPTPPASVEAWDRRRKLLLAGGGITAVFGLAVGVAVMFALMIMSPGDKTANPSFAKESLGVEQVADDASAAPTRSISSPNGADRPLDSQSERVLQRFIQWRQKTDGGRASQ